MKIFRFYLRRFLRAQRLPLNDLQLWRNEMLSAILLVALSLGALTALPSILLAFRDHLYSIIFIDVLAIAWLFTLWRWRSLSFIIRAWNFLFIVYMVGVFFLIKIGPVSQIYLLAVPVIASLLIGLRPAIFILVINAITFLTVGFIADIDLQFDRYHDRPFLRWSIITLNFTFISSVITITCGVLLRRLEESLKKQTQISRSLKNEQKSLHIANEELRLISAAVENLNDMVIITNANFTKNGLQLAFVNKAFERISGYKKEEVVGLDSDILFGKHTDPQERTRINTALKIHQSIRSEIISYNKAGEEFWLEVDIQPINNNEGICSNFVAIARDISERKKAELDIHRLAFFDVLTGLPNRRLLQDRMGTLLANARRHEHFSAVLFIDLDDFKKINDARGHSTGDVVLIEVAQRLTSILREVDTVARIGGDEFVVLLDNLGSNIEIAGTTALTVAEKIRIVLASNFETDGQNYNFFCSMGISILPRENQTVEDLLRESDTAMYKAKAAGRNQIAFFEDKMQTEVEQRLSLEHDLAQALDLDELQMLMQAQVNHEGTTVGAELLMRWNNKKRGSVSPVEFIPLAEQTGLIIHMGEWVISQACEIAIMLQSHGYHFPISLNVSPKQFRQADFVDKVSAIFQQHQVSGKHFIFEVTEGLFIDDLQETICRMSKLAALGIRFSIDDFGTGYSSLNYLKRLPLHELKIDKSFVQDMIGDENGSAIVGSILSMAKQFGLKVVAEGVETEAQAQYLIKHGCDSLQGFLYSKPQAPKDWIAARTKRNM